MTKQEELPLYTTLDDELYEELSQLEGQAIVFAGVWEDSLSSALEEKEEEPKQQSSFDIDIYLADGAYFELYSAACFDSLDDEPWVGLDAVNRRLTTAAKQGAILEEVAADEDDQLVLVVRYAQDKRLYLPAAAWLLEEWDELPAG